jgi:protocadherin Fat 4
LDKFRIDFRTGEVTVESGAKLDREDKSSYTLQISATDRGSTARSGTCTLVITILDVNDELPEFSPPSQAVTVLENAGVGDSVVVYAATDPDLNHDLEYRIVTVAARTERGESLNSSALKSHSVDVSME